MGKGENKEVKRELIFVLLVLCIFVVLVVTWSILGAVDTVLAKSGNNYNKIPLQGNGQVGLTILSETESTGDVG